MVSNIGRFAFTLLLIGTMMGSLSAQSVELVSRAHPSQFSDTGSPPVIAPTYANLSGPPPSISDDGRYVVFSSPATNLVQGQRDMNSWEDVFLRDLATGTTTLVSRVPGSPVTTGGGSTGNPVISGDGRYVAFIANATVTEFPELLLYDRVLGTTSVLFSHYSFAAWNPSLSSDGRYIAFTSDAEDLVPGQLGEPRANVFLYDRVAGRYRLVSHTNESTVTGSGGHTPVISADGRYVAFIRTAEGYPFAKTFFLYDRVSEAVTTIGPGLNAVMSADGSYIVVTALDILYLYDRRTGVKTVVSDVPPPPFFSDPTPAISADGRFIVFLSPEDDVVPGQQARHGENLFLYDRISGTYTLVSRWQDSPTIPRSAATPAISRDGRFVIYSSMERDILAGQTDPIHSWDVFLFDRASGKTQLVSRSIASASTVGDEPSSFPTISANGARVAFLSLASDLVDGLADLNRGQDVFSYETSSRRTLAISTRAPEMPSLSPFAESAVRALSADGRWVAFESLSSNLVAGQEDLGQAPDVFLYDRVTKAVILVSRAAGSTSRTGNGHSIRPVLSVDGRYVAYASRATDIVPETAGLDREYRIFLFDRTTGTTRLVATTGFFYDIDFQNSWQISPDGRWLAFISLADNLIPGQQDRSRTPDVFLWDRDTGSTILVSRAATGSAVAASSSTRPPQLTSDGRYVAFTSAATDLVPGQIDPGFGGGSLSEDLFLFDRITGHTVLVSHRQDSPLTAAAIYQDPGSMSADGRFITFSGSQGIRLYDRVLGTHQLIVSADAPDDARPRISTDGRYVTFVGELRQIYLYDRLSQTLTLVTRTTNPAHIDGNSNGFASFPVISADGRYIAFLSSATDLIPGLVSAQDPQDTNGFDIFLFDRISNTTVLVNRLNGSPVTTPGRAGIPLLSASGRQVAFTSVPDLVAGDFNRLTDAYLFSLDPPPSTGPTPLTPCKLLDTRRRADRPVLTSNVQRTITVRGACGVPATAKQVVVKVTVMNPSGKGNLRFYPGAVTATPSGILRFERGATRTETFTLPLSANGTLTILPLVAGKGTVHGVIEVTGFSN